MEEVSLVRDERALSILIQGGKVLALFYAQWCGFCTRFMPIFQGARAEGLQKVAVDISDEENPLWEAYRIKVVPTVLLFENGRPVSRKDGGLGIGLSQGELLELVTHS